jgi:hypothetical protein
MQREEAEPRDIHSTGVHIGIFRALFVTRLQWLDDKTFLDLFSISNALPGPGSTQLLFSISLLRNGVAASILTFVIWRCAIAWKCARPWKSCPNLPIDVCISTAFLDLWECLLSPSVFENSPPSCLPWCCEYRKTGIRTSSLMKLLSRLERFSWASTPPVGFVGCGALLRH